METIHMIGYDAVHPSDFVYDMPEDHGYYLLILTQSPAVFRQGETMREYPAGRAVLFTPQSRIHYGACGEPYRNDWMIFDSDEPYVTRFPLPQTPFPVRDTEYCHNLFQLLTWEHRQDNHELTISQLMSVLFARLRSDLGQFESDDVYGAQLTALRREIASHPQRNWKVEDMAEKMHISAGYLQALYKQYFGVSCIDDVIRSRIRLAQDYLTHTNLQVSEIAAMCGYRSSEHFCRQFRRLMGESPGQFRMCRADRKNPVSAGSAEGR